MSSTVSVTNRRRRTCSPLAAARIELEQAVRRASRTRAMRSIVRAMSRMDAAGTSWSWGATAPPAVVKPRCFAFRMIAPRKPRLADARLAGQQQELAVAGRDVLEASVDEVEQVVTPDEERATDDAQGDLTWSRSVGQGLLVRIGHSTDAASVRRLDVRSGSVIGRSPDDVIGARADTVVRSMARQGPAIGPSPGGAPMIASNHGSHRR